MFPITRQDESEGADELANGETVRKCQRRAIPISFNKKAQNETNYAVHFRGGGNKGFVLSLLGGPRGERDICGIAIINFKISRRRWQATMMKRLLAFETTRTNKQQQYVFYRQMIMRQ